MARSFAYLFERFPSYVQTFCSREVREMVRQGMDPLILSIRPPEEAPEHSPEPCHLPITYLPAEKELRAEIDRRMGARELPTEVRRLLRVNRTRPDSQRCFEAAWMGRMLLRGGIRHVHAHFGGMAARTAWWLCRLFGITYSFTGHANDIFCEHPFPVTNARLVKGATLIVTETDFARRWMQEKYPAARRRLHRVYNGIEVPALPARQTASSPPCLLAVGRYVEKKGFADLIESCGLLRKRGRSFRCQIIGGGPLADELQRLIEQRQLGDSVQLLGPRPPEEVAAHLAAATLFVLPCVPDSAGGSDNLPTVIAEAMAMGVPAVSTTVAGVPEMITHEKSGLLVPPREPESLANALERLLQDPALAQQLGSAGRAVALQKFALHQTVRELKHLLVRRAHLPVPATARSLDSTLRATLRSRFAFLR